VFAWLVSRHSNALFAPADYRDERNYILSSMTPSLKATAFLAAASVRGQKSTSLADLQSVVDSVQAVSAGGRSRGGVMTWHTHVLWVDDKPDNNAIERAAFEAMGASFTLALSKDEALTQLGSRSFAVIIADIWLSKHRDPNYLIYIGGPEGRREGYDLLDEVRSSDPGTPFFFYTFPSSPEEVRKTSKHGGQGCTDNPEELFRMVMRAILTR
jgi:CheY-like chemotaxis protein